MRQLSSILFALWLAGCAGSIGCDGVASADRMICVRSDVPAVTRQQSQQLAEQAARERESLIAYLDSDVGAITVNVRNVPIARHKPPNSVLIPARLINKGHVITAHEITHLLTQGWASRVLKEGLAVFAQYRFGEQQGWPNYWRSVHASARHLTHETSVRTPEDAEAVLRVWRKDDSARRRAAYSVSGSWVMWLIERKFDGDIRRFLNRLYRSGDYQSAVNQTYASLHQEWRTFLKTQ